MISPHSDVAEAIEAVCLAPIEKNIGTLKDRISSARSAIDLFYKADYLQFATKLDRGQLVQAIVHCDSVAPRTAAYPEQRYAPIVECSYTPKYRLRYEAYLSPGEKSGGGEGVGAGRGGGANEKSPQNPSDRKLKIQARFMYGHGDTFSRCRKLLLRSFWRSARNTLREDGGDLASPD